MNNKLTKKTWKNLIISILLTILLLTVLLHYISWHDVRQLVLRIKGRYIFISLIPYFLCYIFRTLRFKSLLLDKTITFTRLFQVHTVHNMLNKILPASLGEVSYLYLLKKNANIRILESTSSLLLARFIDFSVLTGFFLISCFALKNRVFEKLQFIPYATLAGFFMLIGGYVVLLRWGNRDWKISKASGTLSKLINKIKYMLQELGKTMHILSKGGRFVQGVVFSILAMNSIYLFYFFIMRGLGIRISYMEIIFVSSILVPLMLLPVKGLAGFGTHEVGWAIGFLILGYDKEISILTGFAIHIVSLFFVVSMGVQGLIALRFLRNKQQQ